MKTVRIRIGAVSASLMLVLIICLCTACASTIGKSEYSVAISSNPPGAKYLIKDEDGQVFHSGQTPSTVTLNASEGYFNKAEYIIELKKDGYYSYNEDLNAEVDVLYIVNFISPDLAIIGGLIVDPVTGAMWELPSTKHIILVKNEPIVYASYKKPEALEEEKTVQKAAQKAVISQKISPKVVISQKIIKVEKDKNAYRDDDLPDFIAQ